MNGWVTSGGEIAESVAAHADAVLTAYAADPELVEEHAGQEMEARTGGYGRRQIFELVQNGADQLQAGSGRLQVVVTDWKMDTAPISAPVPSSERVSRQMSRLGQRDTAPEWALRSELHRRGLRFRVHRTPVRGVRSRADLVFGPAKTAVYVDGCFWHSCPEHGTMPKSNVSFWTQKLKRNTERDHEIGRLLADRGWAVLRIWEHEDIAKAADRVERVVRARAVPC